MPGIVLKVETVQDFIYEMCTIFLSNENFHFLTVPCRCQTYNILKDRIFLFSKAFSNLNKKILNGIYLRVSEQRVIFLVEFASELPASA